MSAPQPQPVPSRAVVYGVSAFRALLSLIETLAAFVGLILAVLDNGSDMKHAIICAFIMFTAHGVNHNAGGSPV